MCSSQKYLTARMFAQKAGVSTSTISKWLRNNKIKGEKKSGKWMIPFTELDKIISHKNHEEKKSSMHHVSVKAYTIQEFSTLTYLTEYGVEKWLKEGLLESVPDDSGQLKVAFSNLEQPNIKRLIR